MTVPPLAKLQDLRDGLAECNVITILFISLPKSLWLSGEWMIRFFKYLFILIHSDIRLLCGVDAAVGATIGYFSGSAIIGAVSGGVLGVINYELISKRVLGLAPRSR